MKEESKKTEKILQEIFKRYKEPAFGSLTKKEIDVMIFDAMCKCGEINAKDDLYKIASSLKITRAKARNLIYEISLRTSDDESLREELKKLLNSELVYVADAKIGLEISNPFLADYMRSLLKEKKHLTDGSFSPELVRLSTKAYLDLCHDLAPTVAEKLEEVQKLEENLERTKSILTFLTEVVRDTKIPFAGPITKMVADYIEKSKEDCINDKKQQ